jgi:hypothetical protein
MIREILLFLVQPRTRATDRYRYYFVDRIGRVRVVERMPRTKDTKAVFLDGLPFIWARGLVTLSVRIWVAS